MKEDKLIEGIMNIASLDFSDFTEHLITEDQAKEIIDLVRGSEWISVEDELPESGQRLMFIDILKIPYFGWCDDFNSFPSHIRFFNDATQEIEKNITHWQPLPSPPTNKGEE